MTCSNLNSPPAEPKSNRQTIAACAHCGLPVYEIERPEPAYCCCGCEMAASILNESKETTSSPLPSYIFRVALAFILSMFITLLSATIHQENANAPIALSWSSFVLAVIVFALLSNVFFQAVSQEFRKKSFSIATLVFIGSFSAFAMSSWNLFQSKHQNLYFETAAMALTLYVVSLSIDAYFKLKLSKTVEFWSKELSPAVIKIFPDQSRLRLSGRDLRIGDVFQLDSNTPLPVDALVVNGEGEVDESYLTGEALPVLKKYGDVLQAGSIWLNGEAALQATSPFHSSSLNGYFKRVSELKSKQSSFERLAEKGARVLLTVALFASCATLLYHVAFSTFETGLFNALSVLLISCPCGLAIATPIAFWIAIYRLEQAGIVVSSGGAGLEKLASTTCVLLDKTGTLTEGIEISTVESCKPMTADEKDYWLALALSLEAELVHPIAEAFRAYAQRHELLPRKLHNLELITGKGVQAEMAEADKSIRLSILNHFSFPRLKVNEVGLFVDDELKLIFTLSHQPKVQAEQAIYALQRAGLSVAVLTGDPADKPDFIHCDYHAGLSPEAKTKLVQAYQKKFGAVLFVGDGLNDLAAMTSATSSIALFKGANQAKSIADFTLFHSDLTIVAEMISFSKTAKKKVLANLIWSLSYNSIGIALASFGFLNPLWAIAIMTASSSFVTLNSLSLLKSHLTLSNFATRSK